MSKLHETFVDLCLSGQAFAFEIDDFIDQWHKGTDRRALNDFLGFSEEEYAIWVERPEALNHILFARKHSLPFKQALQWGEGYAIAARAPSQDEARHIVEWLKQTGRIPDGP
jgi:hypothetical protein